MMLGLICSFLKTGPLNLMINRNIIDLNILETPEVRPHSRHGAGVIFFLQMSMQHRERARVCAPEKTRERGCLLLYNSHTSICMCQVCKLIKGTQSAGSFWSCIPNRPLSDADALCGWDFLWGESKCVGRAPPMFRLQEICPSLPSRSQVKRFRPPG